MTNSPVNILFQQLIDFDKSLTQPIYIQIAQKIINVIQRRYLVKGTVLPGTRALSKILKIHRNTAVAVYEELASQGWVEIIPNKGTFVLVPDLQTPKIKASSLRINQAYKYANNTGFHFQKSFHLAPNTQHTKATYIIDDGSTDLRLHPIHQFTRWYSASMKRKSLIQKWNKINEYSYSFFQIQLCNYLNVTRGFHLTPRNIISTRSTEMSLYIVSQLIIKQDDLVLVGNMSNYAANMIFHQSGANIKTVPLDNNGLDINYIKQHFIKQNIRCVYICAHRDYPTGVTLSTKRRLELLQLAQKYKFAIIEDDYDYDFQFDGSAMLPMASADIYGVVIYLGKLGQSLFPSFQIGFVVAPENLISEANNYLQLLDKQGDLIQEQMLAELIHEGEIYRLMKKNIIVYKQRRDYLCKLLSEYFDEIAQWKIPNGGLAIWLCFNQTISLVKLAEEAEKLDLLLSKNILYQNKYICAIRLGFGHLNHEEILHVVQKLKNAYNLINKI